MSIKDENEARNKRFHECVDNGEAFDLVDEAFMTEGVNEILEPLNEAQRKDVRTKVDAMSDGWQELSDHLIDSLRDPKVREQFVREALKKYENL
jgi:hypothetical protein